MDLSTVHLGINKRKRKKRVGRGIGSGRGKTSTRGSKGQYASAGANLPSKLKEGGQMMLIRRIPKRGFSNATWDESFHVVNVGELNRFDDGFTVDAAALKTARLAKGPSDGVRILGSGDLAKKLTVKANHFSKSAREKIEAKGGTCELILPPKKPKRNKMKPRPATE